MKKLFIPFVVLLILTTFACSGGKKVKTPPAEGGVLDLSEWDFKKNGPAKLLGDWKFKWQEDRPEFIQPDFDHSQWDNLKVPGSWNKKTKSGSGYGWYRLKVILPSQSQKLIYGLHLPIIFTSFQIYVDGEQFASNGEPGNTKENYRAQFMPITNALSISSGKREMVLAVKVANFAHRVGGMAKGPIQIAPILMLQGRNWASQTKNVIVMGILLMMGLYHLLLFFGRREDKASLFFAIICLDIFVRFYVTASYLEMSFPHADIFAWRMTVEYLTVAIGWAALMAFYHHLFPAEIPRRTYMITTWTGLIAILFTILTSPLLFTKLILVYNLLVLIFFIYAIVKVIIAKLHGRLGAGLILIGSVIFFIAVINDILHVNEVIHTFYVIQFGLVFMIFSQSAVLSTRFAMAHRKSAKLSSQLGEVHEIGTKISKMQELKPLLEQAINDICPLLKVRKGSIFIFNQSDERLENTVHYGWAEDEKLTISFEVGEGVVGESFLSRAVMVIDDVNQEKDFVKSNKDTWRGSKSMMAIPLNYQEEAYGVLILQDRLDAKGMCFDTDDRYIGESLATNVAIQIKNIELLAETAEKARMDQELKTAQAVQKALFPEDDPKFDKLEAAGFFTSASETGGDWYGYLNEEGRYQYILIGDVTGHGTPAALVTSGVRSACSLIEDFKKEYSDIKLSPAMILKHLNKIVYETGVQRYVMTFFVARYDTETRELVYSNAGHNVPLYYSKGKDKVMTLASRGSRLGYSLESEFVEKSITMEKDDAALFYTDGLIENTNHEMEEYGKRNMKKIFRQNASKSVADIRDLLVKDSFEFFGEEPLGDDVTLVVVKPN